MCASVSADENTPELLLIFLVIVCMKPITLSLPVPLGEVKELVLSVAFLFGKAGERELQGNVEDFALKGVFPSSSSSLFRQRVSMSIYPPSSKG